MQLPATVLTALASVLYAEAVIAATPVTVYQALAIAADKNPSQAWAPDSLRAQRLREEAKQRQIKGKIQVAFEGDEARSKDLFKVSAATEIQKGTYPRELRFKVRSDVQYKDHKVQEDVTDVLIDYDYHPNHWLEVYSFVQRSSDSFLSIKERYEIGVGYKLTLLQLGSVKKTKSELEMLPTAQIRALAKPAEGGSGTDSKKDKSGSQSSEGADALSTTLRTWWTATNSAAVQDTLDQIETAQRAIRARTARFSFEVATSMFKELEQGEIETRIGPTRTFSATSPTKKFRLDGDDRYRFVVRPTFRWQPTSALKFDARTYFKLPAFQPTRVDGRLDWRSDTEISAKLDLGATMLDPETVGVVLKFEQRFDNVPPELPETVLQEERTAGNELEHRVAEKTHQILRLGVEVQW